MKKFVFILIWILSTVSCEKPNEKESKGFGKLDGYSYIIDKTHPASGYGVNLPGYGVQIIDPKGHFEFSQVFEGNYTLSVTDNAGHFYKKDVEIQKNKTTSVEVILPDTRKDLSDFIPIDLSKEFIHTWDYQVVGKEEYFYFNVKNSLPELAFYHSAKTGKNYGITFNDKGLPKRVITDHFIFFFDHFNGNKVDLAVLSPSGESQIVREIKTDFTWPTSPKSSQSTRADIIRWTGRVIGAIPCITTGAAAFLTGGAAIPLTLWTCGNYFLKTADNFFDDAGVENGFTKFFDDYKLASTSYTCIEDAASCLTGLAQNALARYADYIDEMDLKEAYVTKIEQLLANNVPLKTVTIQPGSEGKDSSVKLWSFDDCKEYYEHSGNDSLVMVVYDHWGICSKDFRNMLIQFPLSQIPLNATVSSAKLEIYGLAVMNSSAAPTISLLKIKSSWEENVVEWIDESKLELIGEVDFTNQGLNSWYSWDVTSAVRSWISGANNFGFAISSYENSVYAIIHSGDHPNAKTRPKLIISYY
jgi:hypothetical protein